MSLKDEAEKLGISLTRVKLMRKKFITSIEEYRQTVRQRKKAIRKIQKDKHTTARAKRYSSEPKTKVKKVEKKEAK